LLNEVKKAVIADKNQFYRLQRIRQNPLQRQEMQIRQIKKFIVETPHGGPRITSSAFYAHPRLKGKKLVARSLSVLLPVKNAQSTLAPTVHRILDVVSEISERIELLIIDDGSADATSEVAMELTRHYPQVRAICKGRSLGRDESIRSALRKSTGEIALIYREEQGTPLDEIVKELKSFKPEGQFYFRMDTAKNPQKMKPSQHTFSQADPGISERQQEGQPQISSRPARPNFMERLKGIVLGE
jgi:hypothetical protein